MAIPNLSHIIAAVNYRSGNGPPQPHIEIPILSATLPQLGLASMAKERDTHKADRILLEIF